MEVCWKVSAVLWIISLCTEDQSFITEATTLALFGSNLTQTWCCTSSTLEHVAPNWRLVAWLCVSVCWRVFTLACRWRASCHVVTLHRALIARAKHGPARRCTTRSPCDPHGKKNPTHNVFYHQKQLDTFHFLVFNGGGSTWLALWNCVSWLRTDVGQM